MAINDGEIVITIRDAGAEGTGTAMQKTGVGANERFANFKDPWGIKTKDKQATDYLSHKALDFLKQEVMMNINHYISTIGVRTGNYLQQQNTQAAMNLAYKGVGLGMTAAFGWKVGAKIGSIGGPMGAIIGTAIGGTLSITSLSFQIENYQRQIMLQNRDIALIRQRAGLDTYSDGGRGTAN